MQMGAYVVRLGRRGVVHIAPDVTVVLLGFNFLNRYKPGVALNIFPLTVGMDDFRDVFRTEEVLCLALAIFTIGIDEEDVFAVGSVFFCSSPARKPECPCRRRVRPAGR